MELTGLTEIQSRYIDEENKEAMFQLDDNDWYGWSTYAVIRGNDIYLVEELLSSWDDKRYRCLKIAEPDGKIFYAYSYDKENRIYEEGFLNDAVCILDNTESSYLVFI